MRQKPPRERACRSSPCDGRPGRRSPVTGGPRSKDVDAAIGVLGDAPRRVFLAIGRQEVGAFATAPKHDYLIRSVDPVEPPLNVPHATYIVARGPFSEDDERALLKQHCIEIVVAKNSGGQATYGKIAAARALGVDVIMLRRPSLPEVPFGRNGAGRRRLARSCAAVRRRTRRVDQRRQSRPLDHARQRRADDDERRHVGRRRIGRVERGRPPPFRRGGRWRGRKSPASTPADGAATARTPCRVARAARERSDCRAR